jgi:N-carbamoyl-L-amino-acid hydrolase
VPTGGKFDGALGVLTALEVLETLNDHDIVTQYPLEIVSWTNEEGSRFTPPLVGSGVFAGEFSLEFALSRQDKEGHTFASALKRIGYAGDETVGGRPFKATFELHIEQGPVLESQGMQIGIVVGVQGMRWYEVEIRGKEAHAGPTPMSHRRDPVKGMIEVIRRIFELADKYSPDGRATIGAMGAEPGVINTVPGRVIFKVDLRHPSGIALQEMHEALHEIVGFVCRQNNLRGDVQDIWNSPPVEFDPGCIKSVRDATRDLDLPAGEIVSGAGHDAAYINRVAPTSMVFIPCKDGLSHNELESAKKEDVIAGCDVLLHAVLAQAA